VTPEKAKRWRDAYGLSQADVAAKLGVTRGTYALWEQARSPMSAQRIARLIGLVGRAPHNGPPEPPPPRKRRKPKASARPTPKAAPVSPEGPPRIRDTASPAEHEATTSVLRAFFADKDKVDPAEFIRLYGSVLDAFGG
jgi:DNA-binding XRE family transcriptional regulator